MKKAPARVLKGRTLEQKDEVRRLYAGGVSPSEISIRVRVPVSTIKHWCVDLVRQMPNRGGQNRKPRPIRALTPREAWELAVSGAWR